MLTRFYAVLLLLVTVQTSCTSAPAPELPKEVTLLCEELASIAGNTVKARRAGESLGQIVANIEGEVRQIGWDRNMQVIAEIAQKYARIVYAHPEWTPNEAATLAYRKCMQDARSIDVGERGH